MMKMNSWQKSERVNEWAEIALNVAGMILLVGGGIGMCAMWLLRII